MTTQFQVTFDCSDPAAQAQFWCAALGYELDAPPAGYENWDDFLASLGVPADARNTASACHDPSGRGPRLFFQQVPEDKIAKNRLHLDLRKAVGVDDPEQRMAIFEAEAARLVALGAEKVERFEPAPPLSHGFIVMRDPEGNEFCLD